MQKTKLSESSNLFSSQMALATVSEIQYEFHRNEFESFVRNDLDRVIDCDFTLKQIEFPVNNLQVKVDFDMNYASDSKLILESFGQLKGSQTALHRLTDLVLVGKRTASSGNKCELPFSRTLNIEVVRTSLSSRCFADNDL